MLFFLRSVGLGLLLQRAAGVPGPDPEAWDTLIARVVASFGDPSAAVAATSTTKSTKSAKFKSVNQRGSRR